MRNPPNKTCAWCRHFNARQYLDRAENAMRTPKTGECRLYPPAPQGPLDAGPVYPPMPPATPACGQFVSIIPHIPRGT
mgnify:CR=1 FL=1